MGSNDLKKIGLTSGQMRAARALLRWSSADLAEHSALGVATIKRAESEEGMVKMTAANAQSVRRTLEEAGIEFIPQNGGGAGVRMREPQA